MSESSSGRRNRTWPGAWAVAGTALGLVVPAVVLGVILITSLERERMSRLRTRSLERQDAIDAVRDAVDTEIARLRERPADLPADWCQALRSFWPDAGPGQGVVRWTDRGLLPFECLSVTVTAGHDRTVLGSAEFRAGLQALERNAPAEARARFHQALEEPGVDRVTAGLALARVLLMRGQAAQAVGVLEQAGFEAHGNRPAPDEPPVASLTAIQGYRVLAEALKQTGDTARAAAAEQAADRWLEQSRSRIGYLAYRTLKTGLSEINPGADSASRSETDVADRPTGAAPDINLGAGERPKNDPRVGSGSGSTAPPADRPTGAGPNINLGAGGINLGGEKTGVGNELRRLDALYQALAAGRDQLARGRPLVLRPPAAPAAWGGTLVCAGAREPGFPGGQPLRFASCRSLLRAARSHGLDRFLERRGFSLRDERPAAGLAGAALPDPHPAPPHTEILPIGPLDRTLGLVDLRPVAGSLATDPHARSLLLLGALTLAVVGLGLVITLRAMVRHARLARLRADFVSSVSHELKTPVTSLLLFADLLRSGAVSEPDKVEQYHHHIGEEAGKLAHLVRNVLDFSRLEQGRLTCAHEAVDVGSVVAEAVASFEGRAAGAGVTLETDSIHGPTAVLGDREALDRVVANLLDNAVKYGGNGPVTLSLERSADRVRLRVADRGPGVPRDRRRRIFRRFERGAHHGPDAPPGSGLGLAIVAEVVAAHRGRVHVEDRAGGGAVFVVDLPAATIETRPEGTVDP